MKSNRTTERIGLNLPILASASRQPLSVRAGFADSIDQRNGFGDSYLNNYPGDRDDESR